MPPPPSAVRRVATRRTQADRSSETKDRLIEAAISCLIEDGYAYTTTVNVCARADLTRGAYNHHYSSAADLYVDVLQRIYSNFGSNAGPESEQTSIEAFIRRGWANAQRPEFKAVIEIWLASRNDASVGDVLAPAIAKLSQLFDPGANSRLAKLFGSSPETLTFYRLAFETIIGLALGRATSPAGKPVEHEVDVIELLASLARDHDRRSNAGTR